MKDLIETSLLLVGIVIAFAIIIGGIVFGMWKVAFFTQMFFNTALAPMFGLDAITLTEGFLVFVGSFAILFVLAGVLCLILSKLPNS